MGSPCISSSTLTPRAAASGSSREISGRPLAVSHLEMVLALTESVPASSAWVRPLASRSCRMVLPVTYVFIMNETSQSRVARQRTGCGSQHPLRTKYCARVLLAAAPTTPPFIRHWRRSSLLPLLGELRKALAKPDRSGERFNHISALQWGSALRRAWRADNRTARRCPPRCQRPPRWS